MPPLAPTEKRDGAPAQSTREVAEVAKLKRQQDHTVRRMASFIDSSSSFDITDGFDDPPSAADAYPEAYNSVGDWKGKWPTRKW